MLVWVGSDGEEGSSSEDEMEDEDGEELTPAMEVGSVGATV